MQPEDTHGTRPDEETPLEDSSPSQDYDAEVDEVMQEPLDESEKSVDQRVIEAEKEALMARAEMENFRKRMQRESDLQLKYANMSLVRDLLEVWDNLQRALEAAENDENTKALRDGVAMVSQQMSDTLSKYGCKRIPALGEVFDPNVHEAISQMPSEEYEAGLVMNEVAVGYLLHDRVVRPSHVVVSTGGSNQG